jgi:hypothetical protein
MELALVADQADQTAVMAAEQKQQTMKYLPDHPASKQTEHLTKQEHSAAVSKHPTAAKQKQHSAATELAMK